jgi:2-C-methyl-D-erythritol 4-phosphate cytidylyltransferase
VVVIREGMEGHFNDLASTFHFSKAYRLTSGGAERQDSVWNGLCAVHANTEIVAIQDGARPCTSDSVIQETISYARETGAAVACQPVTDTIKESSDGVFAERTLDRSNLWAMQTPQVFRVEVIRQALGEVRRRKLLITDDTAACELVGQRVRLVVDKAPNPKVTRPEDLPYIEILLSSGRAS